MNWLILFCAFSVSAQVARLPLPIVSSKRVSNLLILYSESFEGTGYEVAHSESGSSPDEDDTASPTAGSQNLKITAGVSGVAWPTAGWAAASVITMTGSFKVSAVTGSLSELYVFHATPDSTARGYIWVNAGGKLEIVGNGAGSVSAATVDSVVAGTQYYIKAVFNKTSGAYNVEFATTFVFIGSGNKYAGKTDGDTGVTIGDLQYRNPAATVINYFDQTLVTTP